MTVAAMLASFEQSFGREYGREAWAVWRDELASASPEEVARLHRRMLAGSAFLPKIVEARETLASIRLEESVRREREEMASLVTYEGEDGYLYAAPSGAGS